MTHPFDTPVTRDGATLAGPWRSPRQMLSEQSYDGHASIHDDATAQKLGFKGGTIEGPTHFTQFEPLAYELWGERWFREGCISVHFRAPVFEGEQVRALIVTDPATPDRAAVRMEREDGTEILVGSIEVGRDNGPTALEARLAGLSRLADPVILRDVHVGMVSPRIPVRMAADDHMGQYYPFTLAQKRLRMTEPSPRFETAIPLEMISVLIQHKAGEDRFAVRGPHVGLFADQEIRLIDGPLEVGADYEIEREIVGLSGSRRTESMWVKSRVYRPGSTAAVAEMLLNSAIMKESYPLYAEQHAALYPA
ncbi:hypothetical protein OLX02_16735 [Novosphingobium sp. KCTC 2891]|uniref:hypothetical protein n=1 Tax=Novosphingobium sp. KCTC 2891 TaxID=2989730 RepID=UPI002223A64D|nr:hypothetical protein [Novosphingobium sp. KCTC 2891]MCW1384470.1 hypothetical protein [Novosphingobium sp. KCTC 2891]